MRRLLLFAFIACCSLGSPGGAAEIFTPDQFGNNFCDTRKDEPIVIGPERPDGLPVLNFSKPIPEFLTKNLPLERIRSATYPDGVSTERDYAWLVYATLTAHTKIVAYYRKFLVKEGASDALLSVFDKAAVWREDICAKEPTEAYLHFKNLSDYKSDDPVVEEHFSRVAFRIADISRERFSPLPYYDSAMRSFEKPEHLDNFCDILSRLCRSSMRGAATLNHIPAIEKMIRRSLDLGNRAEAYFWMQRAKRLGLDVDDDIQALEPKLTDRDRFYLARWKPDLDVSSLGKDFSVQAFRALWQNYPTFEDDEDILCPDQREN